AALSVGTEMIVEMLTNSSTDAGVSETSWKIVDVFSGFTIYERKNCTPNTQYSDTVKLLVGMYKLVVEDAGCDGLSWWANSAGGTGSRRMRPTFTPFPVTLTGYFGGDLGCGFTQFFNVDWPTDVEEVVYAQPGIDAYPNPAQNTLNVNLKGMDNVNGTLQL